MANLKIAAHYTGPWTMVPMAELGNVHHFQCIMMSLHMFECATVDTGIHSWDCVFDVHQSHCQFSPNPVGPHDMRNTLLHLDELSASANSSFGRTPPQYLNDCNLVAWSL